MNDVADGDSSARERRLTACNRDCPDACAIVATIEDGRITHFVGDPAHPVTRGFLSHRTNRYLERQYAPDRHSSPSAENGDAGSGVAGRSPRRRTAGLGAIGEQCDVALGVNHPGS